MGAWSWGLESGTNSELLGGKGQRTRRGLSSLEALPAAVEMGDVRARICRKKKGSYRMLTHIYIESKKKKKGSEEPRGRTGIKMQT